MLTVLEVKRDAMLAEEKSLVSPQEEREKLFKQVGAAWRWAAVLAVLPEKANT